jgi:hypothetical protein
MPSAPISIYTPQTNFSESPPQLIFNGTDQNAIRCSISGVTTAGVNGMLYFAGWSAGKVAFSTDGTQTDSLTNIIMSHDGTSWRLKMGTTYLATKASLAQYPAGLTAWTITTGVGSPTVGVGGADLPDFVVTSYTPPTVSAPAVVFVP